MKTTSIFKKTAVFSTVILLVLLMAFSVVPFTVSAADETESEPVYSNTIKEGEGITSLGEKLSAMNISQSGNIKMLFYYTELDSNGFDDDDYIEITVPQQGNNPDKVYRKAKKDLKTDEKDGVTRYVVEVKVAAAQQTDLVSLQWVKVDGNTETRGWIRQYSVKFYANTVIGYANSDDAAKQETYGPMENSVVSMLNYGAMAQTMFNHNTDKLANEGLFDNNSNPIDNMTADHLYDATVNEPEGEIEAGVEFVSANAYLQDGVQLRIYFTAPEGAVARIKKGGEYVGGAENPSEFNIHTDEKTGYKFVNLNNIAAHNFAEEYTIEIAANGNTASRTYSVLEYALTVLNNYRSTEEQKNTAKALYLYYAWTKNYATVKENKEDSTVEVYNPGPKDENGTTVVCTHTRSHIESDKFICSDCGHTGIATRLSATVSADTPAYAGQSFDVTVTLNVAGDVNISALIVTLTPDSPNLTLSYVEGSAQSGYSVTVGDNVVIDTAGAITSEGTLVTLNYKATATEAGIYKITPVVSSASNSDGSIEGQITVSHATLEVKNAPCEYCSNGEYSGYDATATQHRAYCDKCENTFPAEDHSYSETYVDANGVRTYQSLECVCGTTHADNVEFSYKIGFDLEKNDKAPLLVVTPTQLYKNSSTALTKYDPAENGGAYITYKNLKGAGDAYFNILDGNTEITGRYVAIKYRTNRANATMFLGANNGKTTPNGDGDWTAISAGRLFVEDGQWRLAIMDLGSGYPGTIKPEADGVTYSVDYLRLDVLEGINDESIYYDVAYVAFSDDYMSLASFAGNDRYVIANTAAADTYHSGSTVTGNPVFDSAWISTASNGNSGGGTAGKLTHTKDTANNNLPYVNLTKQENGGSDSSLTLHGKYESPMPTTANAKYVGFLYRRNASSNIDLFVNSTHSGANGAGDNVFVEASTLYTDDNWHFKVVNISGAMNTSNAAHFDPEIGLSSLRFDYWNTTNGAAGDKQIDLAFIGIFETPEQAYAYMGQYAKDYLNVEGGQGCMHDATVKGADDCYNHCAYCDAKVGDPIHTYPTVYSVAEGRGEDGKLYEERFCTVCGHRDVREMFFYNSIDAVLVNGKVTDPYSANKGQSAYLSRGRYVLSKVDAPTHFHDGNGNFYTVTNYLRISGWFATNGGVDRIVYQINNDGWKNANGTIVDDAGGIKTYIENNFKDIQNGHLGAAFQNSSIAIPAAELQKYAEQTVTVTFAVVPKANPGTAEDPNVLPFVEISNVFIDCDHSRNTSEFTLDLKDPQHLSTNCTFCHDRITQGATLTTGGGNAFIGGSNLSVSGGGTKEQLTETYGNKAPLSFTRIHSTGSTVEERSTVYSSSTRITTKRYIAMMWRSTVSSSPEIALDTSTAVKRNVWSLSQAGTGATAPVGEWHFGLISYSDHDSYSMNGTDTIAAGAGNVTLDYINGSVARTTSDYVDVAFIAFFDSPAEAWAYYNLYAAAYLSEEECQHFTRSGDFNFVATETGKIAYHCSCGKLVDESVSYCQHYDFEKLTNVTAVENDGVIDYTADCGICGATGVSVDLSTPGGLQFFNPGRLQQLTASNRVDTKRLDVNFPVLKDANGMPYLHVYDKVGAENYVYLNYGGDETMSNVGKYFAVMYRNESFKDDDTKAAAFQFHLNLPGTTGATGSKSTRINLDESNQWGLAVFDFSTWSKLTNEAGWMRLDFIDNYYAKGNSVDIAWAGFFSTMDEANDYFAAYLDKYEVADHVCAPAYNWKQGADMFTYQKVCYICGETIGEAVGSVTEHGHLAWTPEDIKNLDYSENAALKTFTLMNDAENGNMPFVRLQYTSATSAENFLMLNKSDTTKYNAGKVVAFIYRNNGGGIKANEMFARYDNSLGTKVDGDSNNKYSYNYKLESANMTSKTWSLGYFDYTNNASFDAWNGLGAMRLDVANGGTVNVGDYLDIAAVATFNTIDEALEFYDSFANEYDFDTIINRYCFNAFNVGGTKVKSAFHATDTVTVEVDASNITVGTGDAKFINIHGWYLNPYGTEGYYYRVTDENGNVGDLQFIMKGTDNAPGTAINDVGKALGYNVNICGLGSSFAYSLNYSKFTEYEGQKITVELIAKHNTGREAVMVTINNLYVCAHKFNVTPVIENDGNADGILYEISTCTLCGKTGTAQINVKGWLSNNYFDGVDLKNNDGTLGTSKTVNADTVENVKEISPLGWIAVNGGISKYVYRVTDASGNVSDWMTVQGKATNASSDIKNDGGFQTLVNATAMVDFRNNNGNKIYTADLSSTYAGQTVKVEFAIVPANNPGTDAAPNTLVFLTYTNVHVAE